MVPARLDRRRAGRGRAVGRDVLHRRARRRAAADRPRPRRRAPGVLQRLPPPRDRGRRGAVRQGRPLPVPVPLVDLRPRGQPRPGQAHRRPRRLLVRSVRARERPDGDVAGLRVRQPLPGGAAARRVAGRPAAAPRPVRLLGAARRPHRDLRGRQQLEVHRRELQRVLPLPGDPPPAQQADAVRPRWRLRPDRAVAGRLDGARRDGRDDGDRRRPPQRPAGDRRA